MEGRKEQTINAQLLSAVKFWQEYEQQLRTLERMYSLRVVHECKDCKSKNVFAVIMTPDVLENLKTNNVCEAEDQTQ